MEKEQLLKKISKVRKIHKELNGLDMEVIIGIPEKDFNKLNIKGYKKGEYYLIKDEGSLIIEIEKQKYEVK